jgi:SAM-dependent methyltransferase
MRESTAVEPAVPLYTIPGMTEWNHHTIRKLERGSIRAFMEKHKGYLQGRVLDFGCGQKPYADMVSGQYVPFDYGDPAPEPPFDVIMCNQVAQYLSNPPEQMRQFAKMLKPHGYLVMTYPTNWDEVETEDLFRFTKSGMEWMVKRAGFKVLVHQRRAEIQLGGFRFPLGYGIVAESQLREIVRAAYSREDSTRILTERIRDQKPFVFIKFGDGALECIYRTNQCKHTCDKEAYTPELAQKLQWAWHALMRHPNTYAGDWMTASFTADCDDHKYITEWEKFVAGWHPNWLHFECLLIMSESQAVVDFYRAVKEDCRRKVLIGRPEMDRAALMLNAEYVPIPMTTNLLPYVDYMVAEVERHEPEVVLYGAGMAGNIAAAELIQRHPHWTLISIGSALDPIFVGRTRTDQLSQLHAQRLFRDLL